MRERTSDADAKWIQDAVIAHEADLLRYVKRLLGDAQRSREVVQESFLKLWQAERIKVEDHVREWLFTVCRNGAFEQSRKEKFVRLFSNAGRIQTVPDSQTSATQAVESREEKSEMLRALAELTPDQQEIVRLRFAHELSYEAISRITGLSASNVGFIIHTAIRRMRASVAQAEIQPARAGGVK